MTVVLFSGDLMVVARVAGAVEKRGGELHIASSVEQVEALCREVLADVLIIDLAMSSLDVAELMANLKSHVQCPRHIVAFGPHVHEARLAAARDVGCDQVVSRGQFFGQLEAILQV